MTGSDSSVRAALTASEAPKPGINRYGREYTTPDRAVDIVTTIFLAGCAPR